MLLHNESSIYFQTLQSLFSNFFPHFSLEIIEFDGEIIFFYKRNQLYKHMYNLLAGRETRKCLFLKHAKENTNFIYINKVKSMQNK